MNGDNKKLAEYGSWLCNDLFEKAQKNNDLVIIEYYHVIIPEILDLLETSQNQSILRNWLRILNMLTVSEEFDGRIVDITFNFIQNPQNKVALQAFSMPLLSKVVQRHIDLLPEVLNLIELHKEGKSNAYLSASRTLKKNSKTLFN